MLGVLDRIKDSKFPNLVSVWTPGIEYFFGYEIMALKISSEKLDKIEF